MSAVGPIWNRDRFRLRFVTLTFTAAFSLALFIGAASAQQASFAEGGATACLKCHETDKIMGILETPHANFKDPRSPASRKQCESCHGPSAKHMEFPMQVGNIVFTKHGKTPIAERNQACLACHHEGEQSHWGEGAHAKELSCPSCHVIHKPKDPMVVTKNQTPKCTTCHARILESAPVAASHPLSGPKAMDCTQCHNPHGPTNLASCASCHIQDAPTFAKQSPKAQDYHARGLKQKIDCTACHKGFVHSMSPLTLSEPQGTH